MSKARSKPSHFDGGRAGNLFYHIQPFMGVRITVGVLSYVDSSKFNEV